MMALCCTLVRGIAPAEIELAKRAAVIRALGKRVVGDVIEIGRNLAEAKQIAGHGNWLPWLEREFGWKETTALRFMRCHEFAQSAKLPDLELPVSGLYLLAAPSTPEEARDQVIDAAERGDKRDRDRTSPAQSAPSTASHHRPIYC